MESGLDSFVPRYFTYRLEHRPTDSSSFFSHQCRHSRTSCHSESVKDLLSWWMEHSSLSFASQLPWMETPGTAACLGLEMRWLIAADSALRHGGSSQCAFEALVSHTKALASTWDPTWRWNWASSTWQGTEFLWLCWSQGAIALCWSSIPYHWAQGSPCLKTVCQEMAYQELTYLVMVCLVKLYPTDYF